MAGLLASAFLQGIGQGGKAYLDQEEARRREAAANQEAYNRAYFSAGLSQDARERAQESEDKRKKERYAEFQAAVTEWRKKNPDAPPSKMLADFADTEFVDLLAGKLQAAKLINDEQAQKALEGYRGRELDIREKTADRAAVGQDRANALAAMQIKQAQAKLDEAERSRAETEQKKGLLRGYVTSRGMGRPEAASAYARELEALGVSVGPKPEFAEQTTKTMDDSGGEVTTKRQVPVPSAAGAVPNARDTGQTAFFEGAERPVYQLPTGQTFVYGDDGVPREAKPGAAPAPRAEMTPTEERAATASPASPRRGMLKDPLAGMSMSEAREKRADLVEELQRWEGKPGAAARVEEIRRLIERIDNRDF